LKITQIKFFFLWANSQSKCRNNLTKKLSFNKGNVPVWVRLWAVCGVLLLEKVTGHGVTIFGGRSLFNFLRLLLLVRLLLRGLLLLVLLLLLGLLLRGLLLREHLLREHLLQVRHHVLLISIHLSRQPSP